jgi:hypothetical protein
MAGREVRGRPLLYAKLAVVVLATGILALVLEHLDPALAFASVLALAVVLGALALSLAGTAVHTKAAALEFRGRGAADQGA